MWLEYLRQMKASSGMTTAEISKGSGIPEPTLEKIFAGKTKDPKLPTMQKLVHFLGYTLDDLSPKEKISEPHENGTETLSVDEVISTFVSAGIVPKGKDLSQADLQFLSAMLAAIDQWFSK